RGTNPTIHSHYGMCQGQRSKAEGGRRERCFRTGDQEIRRPQTSRARNPNGQGDDAHLRTVPSSGADEDLLALNLLISSWQVSLPSAQKSKRVATPNDRG